MTGSPLLSAPPPHAVAFVFAGIFGAVVGSFLNACIFRLPRQCLSINRPRRSSCPGCRTSIAWHDNIPILSFLLLRGRCRHCGMRIGLRYPFVEALSAALFVLSAALLVPQAGWGTALVAAAFSSAIIVASAVDLDFRVIPDAVSLNGMVAAPLLAFLVPPLFHRPGGTFLFQAVDLRSLAGRLGSPWFPDLPLAPRAGAVVVLAVAAALLSRPLLRRYYAFREADPRNRPDVGIYHALGAAAAIGSPAALGLLPEVLADPRVTSLGSSLLGLAFGAGLIWAVGVLGTVAFRKDAMGFGDVKFLGLIGGVLGWRSIPVVLALASVLGSVVGVGRLLLTGSRYIPFGPFLGAAALITLYAGDRLLALLLGFQG